MPPEPCHKSTDDIGDEPSHAITGPLDTSSDEEPDPISNDPDTMGYQPIPQNYESWQGTDEDEENDDIDYSSLTTIMTSVNVNGANIISDTSQAEATQSTPPIQIPVTSNTKKLIEQAETERTCDESEMVAGIWNKPVEHRLHLEKEVEDKIKSLMSGFTLPKSAIPPWAQHMTDEDFNAQVLDKILSKNKSDDNT